jgi:hypothetical protein
MSLVIHSLRIQWLIKKLKEKGNKLDRMFVTWILKIKGVVIFYRE